MLSLLQTSVLHPPPAFILRGAGLLLLIAVVEAITGLLLSKKDKLAKTLLAVLSALTASAALAFCLFSPREEASLPSPVPAPAQEQTAEPRSDPSDTVARFFDALTANDPAAALALVEDPEALVTAQEPIGEGAKLLAEALRRCGGIRLLGTPEIGAESAVQHVELQTLDLDALQKTLNLGTADYLRALWELRPRSELADRSGVYLSEPVWEAWDQALRLALEEPETYLAGVELELPLRETPEGWRFAADEALTRLWNGGLPTEALNLDAWVSRSAAEAGASSVYARPVYTVPEDAAAGPAFDRAGYVHTYDPAVVQAIVDSAYLLLDGEALCWNPSIERMPGSEMVCYCDETILVICWKEVVNYCCLSFCEVRIADGSQLRRGLAAGSYSYGPGRRIVESVLARDLNAVASINGDFYDYRQLGITVYQRQVYRCNPALVDSCFFTASGDMLLSHRGELAGEGEAEQFVRDNDVVFGIAFGPILVENGEPTWTDYYPQGEVNGHYSRAAIGQLGERHYLLMTCGFGDWYDNVPDINETARYIAAKGVEKAYTLDGGQTAEIYVDGRSYNYIDFDTERPTSDVIYFVTALPEDG